MYRRVTARHRIDRLLKLEQRLFDTRVARKARHPHGIPARALSVCIHVKQVVRVHGMGFPEYYIFIQYYTVNLSIRQVNY